MKLFKSLLVAPATLGLLAPLSATANEVTINDFNPAEEIAVTNSRVDGLEARLNNFEAGGFSDTTTASFSVDMILGAVDSDVAGNSEATTFDYQMGIGLSTSFTGEDSLDVTIDIGGGTSNDEVDPSISNTAMGFDNTTGVLTVDGVAYSFPVGGASVLVGDSTDISAVYTGACSYSAFLDYMSDCGTGNAVAGGSGATAAVSYAFDGGFSLAGGISSPQDEILGEGGDDLVGLEAAYTGDSFGVSLTYNDAEVDGVDTTYVGLNGTYSWDVASLSIGLETEDADGSDEAFGWFAGLTFDEVGPGSVSVGMATTGNFADDADEYYVYEASYSYPVNDGMTITPGIYTAESAGGDTTGVIVKTSFSF
jgi:hypothetical protein